jgi:transcriptional regulator
MYLPRHFTEADPAVLHRLMGRYGFALLVTTVDGEPFASHLPLLVEPGGGEFGSLLGHMARPNPQWRGFSHDAPALAVFSGPHAYVSPSWYASEPAVPTWNYAAVHAHGRPRVVDDHDAALAILERLVAVHEKGRPAPWSLDRVPAEFRDTQLRGIVAFEMPIDRLEGKFKLGQNRPAADRQGAAAGLRATGEALGLEVARMMAEIDGGGDDSP